MLKFILKITAVMLFTTSLFAYPTHIRHNDKNHLMSNNTVGYDVKIYLKNEKVDVKVSNQYLYVDNGIYKSIVSKHYKMAVVNFYFLDWNKVKKRNKTKCKFHYSKKIPYKYQVNPNDYYHLGQDRGHLGNKADFDDTSFNKCLTYEMVNIVPQYHYANAYVWGTLEALERLFTQKYHKVFVMNFVEFSNYKKNNIYIPKRFYKLIVANRKFYMFEVDNKKDRINGNLNVVESRFSYKKLQRFLKEHNIHFYK